MTVTTPDVIKITLNGKHAMTLAQLSDATGMPADTTLRHALRRAGITPDGHLDGRTPLYLVAPTLRKLKARPGRWPTESESALSKGQDQ